MTTPNPEAITPDELARASELVSRIEQSFSRRVVGQEHLREALLVALLANGHVLLESVPGLAKTLAAATLASTVHASFARVQCTPDLLPSDIVGTEVFDSRTTEFRTELGPVHAHFVLLDEINRSSAKTQSAMLEAMQERRVTIGGTSHDLPRPFITLATQNPIDEEGTHVLPQAQMDRFLLKEVVDYPTPAEEFDVVHRVRSGALDAPEAEPVASTDDVLWLQRLARRVHVEDSLVRYVIEIVDATRHPERSLPDARAHEIELGASPRATIAFVEAGAARALLHGRDHVVPDDLLALRHPVLRHRILLSFEAQATGVRTEDLIDAVFNAIPTP